MRFAIENGDSPFLHAPYCLEGCPDGTVDGGVRAKGDLAIVRTETEHDCVSEAVYKSFSGSTLEIKQLM